MEEQLSQILNKTETHSKTVFFIVKSKGIKVYW